jgi:hypothetical protein
MAQQIEQTVGEGQGVIIVTAETEGFAAHVVECLTADLGHPPT